MVTLGFHRDEHLNLLNAAIEQLLNHPQETTIFTKDGKLQVNRLLLALYSPIIQCALTDCCSSSSISLPDFSIASVRVVLDLLTFGFTLLKRICSKDLENILAIAKLLRIEINFRNVVVFVEDALPFKDPEDTMTLQDDKNNTEVDEKERKHAFDEAACKDFSGTFYHKKFRLAGSKGDTDKKSVPVNGNPAMELIDSNVKRMASSPCKQRLSANSNTDEGRTKDVAKTEVTNWVKRVNVEGDIAKYFSPEQLQKVDVAFVPLDSEVNVEEEVITDVTTIPKNKRKRRRNKRNSIENNSKKMRLEKKDVKPDSDAEIDLPGSPVFMSIPDNCLDLDDSSSETVLVIDLKESVDDMPSTPIQFETEEANVEASNGNLLATSFQDQFEKPAVKKGYARYSEEQTSGLRKAFDENNFVSKEKAQILSKELCLTERQIRKWFQWYRAKNAKNRIVTNETEDKFKVKVEPVDDTEPHVEEMIEGDESLRRVEGHVNSLGHGDVVQDSISMFHTPELKKQQNLLDEECNEDEVRPRCEVKVKYDLTGISSIVDIKRKSQSNEQSDTKNAEFQKIQVDDALMISEEEPSTMDIDIDDLLVTSDEEAEQSATPIMPLQDKTVNMYGSNNEDVDKITSPIPSKSNGKQTTAKRVITRYSEQQIAGLQKAFDEHNFIFKEKAQELSKNLCLTEKQVKYWFKNLRKTIAKQNRIMSNALDVNHEDKNELAQVEKMANRDKNVASASGRVNFPGENRTYTCQFYTCELCPKSFLNMSNFTEHLSSHNRASFSNNENTNSSQKVEDEAIGMVFKSEAS